MSTQYTHEGQQRILKLITVLAGNEVNGLAPSEIAKLQECSPSLVTKDLDNLRTAGYAEQVPHSGHWRLSPHLVQIAVKFQLSLGQAEEQLSQTRSRFTRG